MPTFDQRPIALAVIAGLLLCPSAVFAVVAGTAIPSFPSTVTVGQTGVPVSIELRNQNSGADAAATNTVCNAGDGGACSGSLGIRLTPSCGLLMGASCAPAAFDPGVFGLPSTALGEAGSACAGMTFSVTVLDAAAGSYRFTPQPAGTHVTLFGVNAFCRIVFTVNVLESPGVDASAPTAGIQTLQQAGNEQASGAIGAIGTSSDTTTVVRATPSIDTTASPGIVLGAGELFDAATVSGRVNAQPGASLNFQLFGPNDATCTNAPVFESTISYPAAGGPVASASFTPTQAGVYRWRASYSGDVNNNAVTAPCNAPNENVTVTLPVRIFADGFEG